MYLPITITNKLMMCCICIRRRNFILVDFCSGLVALLSLSEILTCTVGDIVRSAWDGVSVTIARLSCNKSKRYSSN